jgi:hypothetical protein
VDAVPDLFPLAVLLAALAALAAVASAWLVRARSSQRVRRRRDTPRHLMVISPESLEGLTVDVDEELTLGRAAGCGITVDDGHVSPLHARLFRAGGHLVVEDLGSTNGTYVNRERVEAPVALGAGDHLQVGDTILELW